MEMKSEYLLTFLICWVGCEEVPRDVFCIFRPEGFVLYKKKCFKSVPLLSLSFHDFLALRFNKEQNVNGPSTTSWSSHCC